MSRPTDVKEGVFEGGEETWVFEDVHEVLESDEARVLISVLEGQDEVPSHGVPNEEQKKKEGGDHESPPQKIPLQNAFPVLFPAIFL